MLTKKVIDNLIEKKKEEEKNKERQRGRRKERRLLRNDRKLFCKRVMKFNFSLAETSLEI